MIQITEIGETDPDNDLNEGLQCITDRMPCCMTPPNRFGEWRFPNMTNVGFFNMTGVTTFYRNRGDDGTVNLNRPSDVMMPTGLFCCEVPDALNVTQRVCATISELEMFIWSLLIIGLFDSSYW